MLEHHERAENDLKDIFSAIKHAAPNLHKAGTFSGETFDALIEHLRRREIINSMETGSGTSTMLFSHLSKHHNVFALDDGNGSISNTQHSSLLRPGVVTFVEGPTQKTLPTHQFAQPLQAALIDGPHGYPFPDLEYYYIYPHLEAGALLIIDDIQIRSVYNLFCFLKADKMFRLDQVVKTTAFFIRTDAPMVSPLGDGWWEQGYNQIPALPFRARHVLKRLLPASLISLLRQKTK
jgi:hypothetical protein